LPSRQAPSLDDGDDASEAIMEVEVEEDDGPQQLAQEDPAANIRATLESTGDILPQQQSQPIRGQVPGAGETFMVPPDSLVQEAEPEDDLGTLDSFDDEPPEDSLDLDSEDDGAMDLSSLDDLDDD
jgi:hypothetical protein